eukprot:scaffold89777_cov78-Phaeocystis_antarctica.AAC.1
MKASVPAPQTRRPARPWSLSARRLSDLGPVNKAILEVASRGVQGLRGAHACRRRARAEEVEVEEVEVEACPSFL